MTELETLERARMYIEKLANGINPLNDEPVSDSDIVNNVRITRCLFYVSSVLSKVIDNGGETKHRKESKNDFQADAEKLRNMMFSDTPIGISEITNRISACKADENMKKLPYGKITQWLTDCGFLKAVDKGNGKKTKFPTSAGEQLGISVEDRIGHSGPYQAVLYNLDAQHFIIDNLDAILNA